MTNARELSSRLADLLAREHGAMADFLVALADFDRRQLWTELGHASLFAFLVRELGLSAGAAQFRKTAAVLLQEYPEVEVPLRDGRLCISTVFELAKVMTPQNRAEVLPRFFHRSRREAMAVAAEIRPAEAAPHRDVVTPVRPVRVRPGEGAQPALAMDPLLPVETLAASAPVSEPAQHRAPDQRDEAVPLTADLSRLHVTVSRLFLRKLDAARDALSHSRPGASVEDILEAGLDLLLARSAKRKGLVETPRKTPPTSKGDAIPAHVKRAVMLRDGGCCQWKLRGGGICGSTRRIELDHVEEKARGGPPTVENVRLLCRFHNQLKARLVFGDAWMDRFARKERRRDGERPPEGPPQAPAPP